MPAGRGLGAGRPAAGWQCRRRFSQGGVLCIPAPFPSGFPRVSVLCVFVASF